MPSTSAPNCLESGGDCQRRPSGRPFARERVTTPETNADEPRVDDCKVPSHGALDPGRQPAQGTSAVHVRSGARPAGRVKLAGAQSPLPLPAANLLAAERQAAASAVVGSITRSTLWIRSAGKPPRLACSRINSSLGAR